MLGLCGIARNVVRNMIVILMSQYFKYREERGN